jgi:hypothetical protein
MKTLLGLVVASALSLCSLQANATLMAQDLATAGDELLTFDTTTNLQWLDLSNTVGLTYQQIQEGAGGWTSKGFRPATRSELANLFEGVGLTLGPPRSTANAPGAALLTNLIGCNLCGSTEGMTGAIFFYGDESRLNEGLIGFGLYEVDVYGEGFAYLDEPQPLLTNQNTILVRSMPSSAVPELGSLSLFSLGLMALALRRRT